MNTQIKRGVEMLLNGQSVWANHDPGGDNVFVCLQKTQDVNKGDEFLWVVREDLKPVRKIRTGISAKPKALTEAKKSFKQELNVFFASQLLQCHDACEECGASFLSYTMEQARGLIAHILPKNEKHGFPDVAIHPQNRMFLGTKCGHHARWDNLGAKERTEMKVYPLAIERFNQFKSLLTEADLIRACKYLNIDYHSIETLQTADLQAIKRHGRSNN